MSPTTSPFGPLAVLVDPRAGNGAVAREVGAVEHALEARGLEYRLHVGDSSEELGRLSAAALDEGYRFLAAVGDDATVQDVVNGMFREGRPIVAVGTTVVRTLEAAARAQGGAIAGAVAAGDAVTDLCLLPGDSFQVVTDLITNFHLPRSTLLMLVAAFAGRENVLEAYRDAIERGYRFYSYGDAMLIRGDDA